MLDLVPFIEDHLIFKRLAKLESIILSGWRIAVALNKGQETVYLLKRSRVSDYIPVEVFGQSECICQIAIRICTVVDQIDKVPDLPDTVGETDCVPRFVFLDGGQFT